MAQFSRIYGLTVRSDIALPELEPIAPVTDPDIVIERGAVERVDGPRVAKDHALMRARPGELWLSIAPTLRMHVSGGSRIVYELEPRAEAGAVRLFLLGSGLGGALMQRGMVVLHGNAVALPGERSGAIICIGESGAGKSTTAVAMMQRGYGILADDICAIAANGRLQPGMPRAKIWEHAATGLGLDTAHLDRIREDDAKFNLPLGEQHSACARSISAFFWLVPADVDAVSVSEVYGVEKFTVLRNNVYRAEYLAPLGIEADYLGGLAQIAAQTPVFKVTRPRAGFAIEPLLDGILQATAGIGGTHGPRSRAMGAAA